MNIRSHYEEIGLLETVRLLEKHRDDPDLMAECTEWLPAVQGGLARRLSDIAEEIRRLGKKKLLLLTPELALLEELAKDSGGIEEIYLEIASETDGESAKRIGENIPDGLSVRLLEEFRFLPDFRPDNAMIAAVGCESRGRMILPKTSYRIMTLYRSFYGVRALISYQPGSAGFRPKNWISADTSELFNLVIEGEETPCMISA